MSYQLQPNEVLFPVARFISGSLTSGRKEDYYGKPLTNKDGTPAEDFSFGIAIPKAGGPANWWETPWGARILAVGQAAFPNGQTQNPSFSWKVNDGDSQVPNKKGNKMADMEGAPGHWVVFLSSRFAPKTFDSRGATAIPADMVKRGHYVECLADVKGNGSAESPGVFINHKLIAHAGFGPEIYSGPDASAVGFGSQALPAGASSTPIGGVAGGAPAVPGVPATPAAPAAPAPQVPVTPDPTLTAGALAPPMPAAPVAPAKRMTYKAAGASYESFIAKGWTDDLLVARGFLVIG